MNANRILSWAALALAVAAPTRAADEVTLERRLTPGARFEVEEQRTTQLEMLWKGRRARVGDAEVTEVHQAYTEEVRRPQPELLVRSYELSTRAKHPPRAKAEAVRTSVHGRRVLVSGLSQQPDGGFELSKEDRELLRLDRLAEAMLPPEGTVAVRDRWTIPAEAMGEALFGPHVPRSNLSGEARVDLKAVKRGDGPARAILRVRLTLKVDRTVKFPGIDLAFKGEVHWDVVAGRMVGAELGGPVSYVLGDPQKNGQLQAEGTASWTYRAEEVGARTPPSALERALGTPPPPGSSVMRCTANHDHAFPVGKLVHCMQCGKALDADRRCPDGHPWPLQYCPLDGAPLEPE